MNRKELVEQIFAKKSFLCVGLDTDIDKLPVCITESEEIQGAEASMISNSTRLSSMQQLLTA